MCAIPVARTDPGVSGGYGRHPRGNGAPQGTHAISDAGVDATVPPAQHEGNPARAEPWRPGDRTCAGPPIASDGDPVGVVGNMDWGSEDTATSGRESMPGAGECVP
jgi:hypothetical protein